MENIDDKEELRVAVKDGILNISIGINLLAFAVKNSPQWPEEFIISNVQDFANSVKVALEDEEEDGSTILHRLFDGAALWALEHGYEGFKEVEEE